MASYSQRAFSRHREIRRVESGKEKGELEITMDWAKHDETPMIREDTRFVFHAGPNMRAIDRITTLTALDERVDFRDNKEGVVAVRMTRALEHPTKRPIIVTDASGKATTVPVMDNEGVTGTDV